MRQSGDLLPAAELLFMSGRDFYISRECRNKFYTFYMSEPAHDLPVDSTAVEHAVELARRGVITHLTIHGERVAAIVPESVIDGLQAAEDAEDAAEADAAMSEPGDSISLGELEAEFSR